MDELGYLEHPRLIAYMPSPNYYIRAQAVDLNHH
jgi:hypothetical protein